MELHRKYRPKTLKMIVGQKEAVAILKKFVERKTIPQALLFVGPTGCGKTTLARIMAKKLKCSEHDYFEQNAADFRGIDSIRSIRSRVGLSPMDGDVKVWVIDEAHQLLSQSQNALLKLLEEPPEHVYFSLATTDDRKLLPTIRSRTTIIKLALLKFSEIKFLVERTCKAEKKKLSEDVIDLIAERAEGIARKALVLLGAVIDLDKEKDQIEAVEKSDVRKQAKDLCNELLKKKPSWNTITKIINDLDDEVETVRHMILGYASVAIRRKIGPSTHQAYLVINGFRDPFYDSGKAGLDAACYEVLYGSS